jgi:hypothetical protein
VQIPSESDDIMYTRDDFQALKYMSYKELRLAYRRAKKRYTQIQESFKAQEQEEIYESTFKRPYIKVIRLTDALKNCADYITLCYELL